MDDRTPPFKFDLTKLMDRAWHHLQKSVTGVTITLPFLSISVQPNDIERKVARELVIRLADKRVLNSFECCDNCIERALASLQEVRALLVDKQVDLSTQHEGALFLIIEIMLEGIRQFFTFQEKQYPEEASRMGGYHDLPRQRLEPYFAGLEMLRGHLYRCLVQIAVIADIDIPKIPQNMRYEAPWQLSAYTPISPPE